MAIYLLLLHSSLKVFDAFKILVFATVSGLLSTFMVNRFMHFSAARLSKLVLTDVLSVFPNEER